MGVPAVVGIPSFRRPRALVRLLRSLAGMEAPRGTRVVVCENDVARGEAAAVVDTLTRDFPWTLTVCMEPRRGISHARNRLLDVFAASGAAVMAMIDDDEWVDPGWLRALLRMQADTGADVVSGRARPAFDGPQPAWTRGAYVYWDGPPPPPGPADMIWTTTNLLLHRRVVDSFGVVRFDPAYSVTGGGDEAWLRTLRAAGARFAFAPDAVSHEYFGPTRATRRWALQRAFRIGASNTRNRLSDGAASSVMGELLRLPFTTLAPFVGLPFARTCARRTRIALHLARQAGTLSGLFGRHPEEYAQVHGE